MTGNKTYVIGHKNPDTDSICSAIGMAELKSRMGDADVVAARAGDLNPQTKFVLDYFNASPPIYLQDVYPRARDIMTSRVVSVREETPVQKVMELMREESVRFVPLLDSFERPTGVVTWMDLSKRYVVKFDAGKSRDVTTSLSNIASVLEAEVLNAQGNDEVRSFSVYIGAMEEGSFVETLGGVDGSGCAVIVGDRADIQTRAVELGVGLLVITGGFHPAPELIEAAADKGTGLVVTPFDTATAALLVRLSTPAREICTTGFEHASPDERVDELKHRLTRATGLVVVDDEGALLGVVTRSSLLSPSGVSLVLVDHNELAQAVDGADMVKITEVIDHHRIGSFQTAHAISFVCEPVGATSTLVAELYRDREVEIKKETAGLLLAGVLSDTVVLKSPTTTERDTAIVAWLEEKAGLEHEKFGAEIFGATSSIIGRGAADVVRADHKVFEVKGEKFGIGQVETVGFDEFHSERERMAAELEKVRIEMGLKLSAVLVTDIVYGTSLLLAVGAKEILYNLAYPKLGDGVYELKGVISRKKQVVPHILGVFNEVY